MRKLLFGLLLMLGASNMASAQSTLYHDLSMFPQPEKGFKQMVIEVPHSKLDGNKKIEFRVGQWTEVDGCNSFMLMGKLEEKGLEGWGYTYYVFNSDGGMSSTMMACPDAPKRRLFVATQPTMVRYNGKLPVVIYVPEKYDVLFNVYVKDSEDFIAKEVRYKEPKEMAY